MNRMATEKARPGRGLRMALRLLASVTAVCVALPAAAQVVPHEPEHGQPPPPDVVFERQVAPMPGNPVHIMGATLFEPLGATPQAPYSAEAVTEVTQVLADGNRINHRTSAKVYRDSAGRTRREQTIAGIGALSAGGDAPRVIVIHDPVAKTAYTLDPAKQEAHKVALNLRPPMGPGRPGPAAGVMRIPHDVPPNPPVEGFASHLEATPFGVLPHGEGEPLGTRQIEGLDVEGTRWVRTIPEGAVGNERPIEVVTERWYSPALKVVVMSKHSDPRLGETVYQLTNVVRAEPPADLFVVPSDYKVVDGPAVMPLPHARKPVQDQP